MATRRKTPLPYPECGKNIRKYRKLAGYTIKQLADNIGIDAKYLSSLESCYQMPSIEKLDKISFELHIPIERLLKDTPVLRPDSKIKGIILEAIDTLTNEELEFLYQFICNYTKLLEKRKRDSLE